MAFFHHGTIRKYTAAILDLFNDLEIQYENSLGVTISRPIPIRYSSREKATIFDEYTTEQLLSGNYSILPRASLSLQSMSKVDSRVTNKNTKINQYKTDDSIEFSFNSVPYEFTFEIIVQCRGMNEAAQIIEQIAPKFNPTVNIDVWDAANLSEPTRIPVRLSNAEDQAVIKRLLPDNLNGLTEVLPILDIGEALIVGDASLLPTRVIVDEPKIKPESATMKFWKEWSNEKATQDIETAVNGLRKQSKS